VGKRGRLKRGLSGFGGDKVKTVKADSEFDDLWEGTAGEPVCPKCFSINVSGHITGVSVGVAVVDWVCEACGHKWSGSHAFEHGSLEVDELEVKRFVRAFPCSDPKCFFDARAPCGEVAFDVKPEFRDRVESMGEDAVALPNDWIVELPFTSEFCLDCPRAPDGLCGVRWV